jgi:hypothetical protein
VAAGLDLKEELFGQENGMLAVDIAQEAGKLVTEQLPFGLFQLASLNALVESLIFSATDPPVFSESHTIILKTPVV